MVGIGVLMLTAGWCGLCALRGKLVETRWLLTPWMIPSGFVALLAGWFTTEIGRQPYVVYGMMRTAEAVGAIDAGAASLRRSSLFARFRRHLRRGHLLHGRLIRKGPLAVEHGAAAPAGHAALAQWRARRAARGATRMSGEWLPLVWLA